jgi:hypothetical protein
MEYVQFLNYTESYAVSEALKLVFHKDKEFKEWLANQMIIRPIARAEHESEHTESDDSKPEPKDTVTRDLFR